MGPEPISRLASCVQLNQMDSREPSSKSNQIKPTKREAPRHTNPLANSAKLRSTEAKEHKVFKGSSGNMSQVEAKFRRRRPTSGLSLLLVALLAAAAGATATATSSPTTTTSTGEAGAALSLVSADSLRPQTQQVVAAQAPAWNSAMPTSSLLRDSDQWSNHRAESPNSIQSPPQATNHQQVVVTKKSAIIEQPSASSAQLSSADLPAEFRDNDDGEPEPEPETSQEIPATEVPREQSKLARLCQQTSSVLASVLPAPFGGHKRSILCQFFGQVQFGGSRGKLPAKQPQFPLPILANNQQIPAGYEPESVAILQQHQQPPVALMTNGLHPIHLVLEQHRRQQQQLQQLPAMDLKSSASVLDHAYHQKLEPPPSMFVSGPKGFKQQSRQPIKYSTPIAGSSFRPLTSTSPLIMSTSGWRIYNQSLVESLSSTPREAPVHVAGPSSLTTATIKRTSLSPTSTSTTTSTTTTSNPLVKSASKSTTTTVRSPTSTKNETVSQRAVDSKLTISGKQLEGPQVLLSGKPPGFSRQVVEKNKKQSAPKSTSAASSELEQSESGESKKGKVDSHGVRTIEVVAQVHGEQLPGASGAALSGKHANSSTSTTQRPIGGDSRQVQKREELVIASINNLTRIAFGNQLRDTVKVINKLIDQQSELFSVPPPSPRDPMQASESQQEQLNKGKKAQAEDASNKLSGKSRPAAKQQVVAANGSQSLSTLKSTKKPKKQANGPASTSRTSSTSSSSSSSTSSSSKSVKRASPTSSSSTTIRPRSSTVSSLKSDRKSTVSGNELRRLSGAHTVSRSLALDSTTSSGARRKGSSKLALIESSLPMPTISDIHRDKKPWQLSSRLPSSPTTSTTTTSAKRLAISSTTQPLVTKSPLVSRSTTSSKSSGETRFPWLLPDKSAYQSDLFGVLGSATEMKLTTADALRNWQSPRKSTSSITEQLISARQAGGAKHSQLALNRLDGQTDKRTSKLDSLTTLKMSLTSTTPTSSTSGSSTTSQPPSGGGGTQSRWIPTATTSSQLATSASTIGTMARLLKPSSPQVSSRSTTKSGETVTTILPAESFRSKSGDDLLASAASTTASESVGGGSSSTSDLNDMKATDSISKYTSHWNEANELLATTRRYYQQPMPQIANTGEFFSAETISNWPERYQTMMASQSTEANSDSAGKTTPSFETTRRNGETYDTANAPRHKLDASSTTKSTTRSIEEPAAQTTRSLMSNLLNLTSVTVLPANHKLTATTQEEESTDTDSIIVEDVEDEGDAATTTTTTTQQQTVKTTSRPEVAKQTIAAYTIIGSQPETTRSLLLDDQQVGVRFPQVIDEHMMTSETKLPSESAAVKLKPPYLGSQDESGESDGPPVLVDGANRAHVSRKLYEQLVPSTKNFVGAQNPLNQYRFNLSALKYLAQNLLASPATGANSTEPDSDLSESQVSYNATGANRMFDLLGVSLPPNYYELPANDSSGKTNSSLTAKGIFGRAGNLLSDLRQLEQKKAAALLAAIRYQVPSPLVKPWDSASDSFTLGGPMRDRFDSGLLKEASSEHLKDSLLLAHLGNALHSVLYKQRLVPRDELERRLSGASRRSDDSATSDRHPDYAYSVEGLEPRSTNMTIGDGDSNSANKSTSLTRKLLDKILFETSANRSTRADFHAIDLASGNATAPRATNDEDFDEVEQKSWPKYIRAAEYQTASSAKPANLITEEASKSALAQHQRRAEAADKKATGFSCDDRLAGFYPDTETACRTFYHCSNTGHLLTFDCPTQTRFDEKSLKCGPWYEVPCDLGRVKSRRFK